MQTVIIAVVAENGVIGRGGTMPWRLKSDMQRFRALTMGKPVVMGRKTYEAARKMSKGKSNPYPGMKSYVFSHRLKARKDDFVELVSKDAVKFVRKLKKQTGKDICVMGGGELAHSLFEAKLIDEIGFNIHPVLLGSGIPLFHEMKRQIDLELLDCKPFRNGCVFLSYRVKY